MNKPLHQLSKVLILSLIVGLVGACDVTDTDRKKKSEKVQPEFKVTNSLQDRMETSSQSNKVQFNTTQDVSVTRVAHVESPTTGGETMHASNITYNPDNDRVYVGYKLTGAPFGGGIDILNVSDLENITTVNSIASANLDVQEVDYNTDESALYVAGAVSVDDADATPSRLSRLTFSDGEIENQTHRILSGNVAKSLGAQQGPVHVINDEQTLYQFDLALSSGSEASLTAGGATGFRSLARMQTGQGQGGNPFIYVLDQSGDLYRTNVNSFNNLQNIASFLGGGGETTLDGIARLEAHPQGNPPMLFASLNQHGFRALNPGGQTWSVESGQYYTGVSAQQTGGQWRVYASGSTIIEVYGDDFQQTKQEIGQFDLTDIPNIPEGQINQVRAVDNRLVIAYGAGGIVVLNVTVN